MCSASKFIAKDSQRRASPRASVNSQRNSDGDVDADSRIHTAGSLRTLAVMIMSKIPDNEFLQQPLAVISEMQRLEGSARRLDEIADEYHAELQSRLESGSALFHEVEPFNGASF